MSSTTNRCFPNGYFGSRVQPKAPTEHTLVFDKDFKNRSIRQEVPNGFIVMHAGVQRTNKTYTSPLLCVYTQRLSNQKSKATRNEVTATLGPRSVTAVSDLKLFATDTDVTHSETDVIIIPVEDVIQISFKADVKKDVKSDSRSEVLEDKEWTHNCCDSCLGTSSSKVGPSGAKAKTIESSRPANGEDVDDVPLELPQESCLDTCLDPVRCWCCRREKVVRRILRTFKKKESMASRILTVSITYSEFNNLDSPSNVRLLPESDREKFFKDKFNPEKEIKFHLVNTTDFESKHFDAKTKDAELLCRIVLHLKAVKSEYPSEAELDKMLEQVPRRIFGDAFSEAASQPVRSKPVRSDPPRSDPPRSDPPRSDPPRSDPPRSDPVRSDPVRSEPPKKPPVTTTSMQDQKQTVPIVENEEDFS